MKKKKGKKEISWLLILGTGAVAVLIGAICVVSKNSYAKEAAASVPPELQSAAVYEMMLQMLPEESPKSGALKIPIFIYHSVKPYHGSDTDMQKSFEVTPELLEKQLIYLHDNGYTPISLEEVAADLKSGTTSPISKPVVLTFDDGWENQYIYAFPLLKKYHVAATFYIYPHAIGTKNFLTWNEIKEMDAAGIHIEGHSLTHPRFSDISLDQIKQEVTESKKILEQKLGKPVVHFASPYGYSNADIITIVKAAEYVTYRTTYKGVYQDNPLRLRGILVTNDFNYFVRELGR